MSLKKLLDSKKVTIAAVFIQHIYNYASLCTLESRKNAGYTYTFLKNFEEKKIKMTEMPQLIKKNVLKFWCENFKKGERCLFQGLCLFQTLEYYCIEMSILSRKSSIEHPSQAYS